MCHASCAYRDGARVPDETAEVAVEFKHEPPCPYRAVRGDDVWHSNLDIVGWAEVQREVHRMR